MKMLSNNHKSRLIKVLLKKGTFNNLLLHLHQAGDSQDTN